MEVQQDTQLTFQNGFNADNTIIVSIAVDLASNNFKPEEEQFWWTHAREEIGDFHHPVAIATMSQYGINLQNFMFEDNNNGYNYRIVIMRR